MACNKSATLLVLLIVSVLFVPRAQADSSEFLTPVARRIGPVPPQLAANTGKDNCPMFTVPGLADACRPPKGLRNCAAQCVSKGYHGGHCDIFPNGRVGDCSCLNCVGSLE